MCSSDLIDKSDGYRVVQTLGSALNVDEIERLWQRGLSIVHGAREGQRQLFPTQTAADMAVENFVEELSNAIIHR